MPQAEGGEAAHLQPTAGSHGELNVGSSPHPCTVSLVPAARKAAGEAAHKMISLG